MRQGLKELAEVIRGVPTVVRDCKSVRADLSHLLEMAQIISHPLSLMFRAGKNFLVNGVDILKKFNAGWAAYRSKDFFNFGMYMGEAMDEVVLKSPAKKKLKDEQAYEFLCGYMDGLLHLLERVNIYNRVDNLGNLVMSPVIKTIQQYEKLDRPALQMGALSTGVWQGLHEFQHAFLDSGSALVRKKAITQPQLDHITDHVKCLDQSMFNTDNQREVVNLMATAASYFDEGDMEGVGEILAQMTIRLCGETTMVPSMVEITQ